MPVDKFENGQQRYEFCKALEKAFPDIGKLRKVVSFGLNQNLNAIADNKNLEDTVFELVHWAETYNKLPKLLESVCNPNYGNPENSLLQPFCLQCLRSQILEEPQPKPITPPQKQENDQKSTSKPAQEQPQPKPITEPDQDDLSSEQGVDYTRLRDLLKAGKWKEADGETLTIMLKAAGREEKGWLSYHDLGQFPCVYLRIIDQLWVKYSNGHFGFSVQKRIWKSVGEDYKKFCDRVGWGKGIFGALLIKNSLYCNKNRLYTNDPTFLFKAPEGYFPVIPFGHLTFSRSCLFYRLQSCKI